MKRFIIGSLIFAMITAKFFAYNPPAGAEDFCLISSPLGLSGSIFTAGNISNPSGAESIVVNPALTAENQRINLNASCTFLFDNESLNKKQSGFAFQTAILIPTKMFVFSGYMNGTFVPFSYDMYLGNSFNIKAGLSKEITEKLNIGISVNSGLEWNPGSDWALGFNCGFVYNHGQLGFLQNFRYGASILNIGKNYKPSDSVGLDISHAISAYPSLFTLKLGAAGLVFKNDLFDICTALDFTIPAFQNIIIDLNLQFTLKQMLSLSVGEKINIIESVRGHNNYIPSIGLFYKFSFNVKNNEYLASRDWSESEMRVSAAYKNMYENVNAISTGVDIELGMKDTTPPQISIMIDEE